MGLESCCIHKAIMNGPRPKLEVHICSSTRAFAIHGFITENWKGTLKKPFLIGGKEEKNELLGDRGRCFANSTASEHCRGSLSPSDGIVIRSTTTLLFLFWLYCHKKTLGCNVTSTTLQHVTVRPILFQFITLLSRSGRSS